MKQVVNVETATREELQNEVKRLRIWLDHILDEARRYVDGNDVTEEVAYNVCMALGTTGLPTDPVTDDLLPGLISEIVDQYRGTFTELAKGPT
jgi:hypothetical protein